MFLGKCGHEVFNVQPYLRDACPWECLECSTNTPAGRARAESRVIERENRDKCKRENDERKKLKRLMGVVS